MSRTCRYEIEPLEREYAQRRITLAAYGCASIYRAVIDAATRKPAETARPDVVLPANLRLPPKIIEASKSRAAAIEHTKLIEASIGREDAELLRALLVGRATFSSLAESTSHRAQKRIGERFRRACEDLAQIYASKQAEELSTRRREITLDEQATTSTMAF